jgi:hypothetical protein
VNGKLTRQQPLMRAGVKLGRTFHSMDRNNRKKVDHQRETAAKKQDERTFALTDA